ncbi:MAG: protein-glutamate O-methyltransferase CheR [Alphaproteobacteria bacterium]|nr:protein-glutamate O-methyltransferase CheR [Alphaproteobacteria bacterium]
MKLEKKILPNERPPDTRTGIRAAPTGELAVLSDTEFVRLAERIHTLSGIVLPDFKRQLVFRRLRKRLHALGHQSFKEYLLYLDSDHGAGEARELINAITTNLTSFFREPHHFDDLTKFVSAPNLPENPSRKIRIWSAACSTGEEPYSIAMTLKATGLFTNKSDARILATDLDTDVLSRADRGIYTSENARHCEKIHLNTCFNTISEQDVQVVDSIKNMITFNQLNLHKTWPMRGPLDVIFCRNVLIYFDAAAKHSIVDRMVKLLRPGGKLYLGHSESMCGHHPDLESQGQTIYQKVNQV